MISTESLQQQQQQRWIFGVMEALSLLFCSVGVIFQRIARASENSSFPFKMDIYSTKKKRETAAAAAGLSYIRVEQQAEQHNEVQTFFFFASSKR